MRALFVAVLAVLVVTAAAGCAVERGVDCSPEASCAAELSCEPRGDGTSVCVPAGGPRLLREPCSAEALCGPGAACVGGLCLIADGQFCFNDNECVSNDCESRCGLTSCAVGVECPCVLDDDCGDGEVCAGSECGRTCVPGGVRGDVCVSRVEGPCDVRHGCADDLACAIVLNALEDGVCLPSTERAAGELCNRDDECASATCGDDNACT